MSTEQDPPKSWSDEQDEAFEALCNDKFVPVTMADLAEGYREHGMYVPYVPLTVSPLRQEDIKK